MSRTHRFGVGILALTVPLAGLAQSPYPISVAVLEGDLVPGVGLVTRIDNLAVNDDGDWIVEADTDFANADADSVLLLNGTLYLREGELLAAPAGARIGSFDSVNLNGNADSGWNLFLDGPPSDQDSGVFFNDTLVVQEGAISTAPQFTPGTPYIGFFDAKLSDANRLMVVASVDDPSVASTVDRAITLFELDGAGGVDSESVLVKEGDVLPGQTDAVAEIATGPHESAINELGQVLYLAQLDGPAATDGAMYLDHALVVQEGDRAPVAGRFYETLTSRGRDVDVHGDVFFKANVDGDTADDEMLIRNEDVIVREGGSLPAIGGFAFTGFGTSSGPVRIDDHRNLLWFGDWNDPDTDVDTGLFLNGLLLVQEGVTQAGGFVIDTIASGTDAFALSEDGRFVIFEATLVGGIEGALLIEIAPPLTVPDGSVVAGTQLTAARNANGTDVDVFWDATTCTADDYHLFFGDLSGVSDLSYAAGSCDLGTTGQTSFTPPAGSIFWTIVAVDDADLEGSHGFDGDGVPRAASADGLCSVVAQVNGSACAP